MNLSIVYEPSGRAREYSSLGLNLFKGCPHKCLYCYGPANLKLKKEVFHTRIDLKKDALKKLAADSKKLELTADTRNIQISFIGDPYMPEEFEQGLTRQAIEILLRRDLFFSILTKGGTRATRDFDLLSQTKKASFGTSLTFINQKDGDYWEPNAPGIRDRIKALEMAYSMGIKTWVSLEPVIIPGQALQLIRELHPIVSNWKVGKLNYMKPLIPVNWGNFREEVKALLTSLDANFYLKRSLTEI